MTFRDQIHRESFAKKFVRDGQILKIALEKLPNYNTTKLERDVSNVNYLVIVHQIVFNPFFHRNPHHLIHYLCWQNF